MVYCTYNMLNTFRTHSCPTSVARDYMCVITAYGVQRLGCWLLEVTCKSAGYASEMRDVAVQRLGCWLLEVRCKSAGYASEMRDVAGRSPATSLISEA